MVGGVSVKDPDRVGVGSRSLWESPVHLFTLERGESETVIRSTFVSGTEGTQGWNGKSSVFRDPTRFLGTVRTLDCRPVGPGERPKDLVLPLSLFLLLLSRRGVLGSGAGVLRQNVPLILGPYRNKKQKKKIRSV